MKRIFIPLIISLITIVIFGLLFYKNYSLFSDKIKARDYALNFLYALLPILISIWTLYFTTRNTNPEYESLNKPYLQPELVISEVNKNDFSFYFIIENSGNLPAEDVHFNVQCKEYFGFEISPPYSRKIAPKSKIKYDPVAIIQIPKDKSAFMIELTCYYTTKIDNKYREYKATYKYSLTKNDIKLRSFIPDLPEEYLEKRSDDQKKLYNEVIQKALKSPATIIPFWFNKDWDFKETNNIIFQGWGKSLIYNKDTETISFIFKISENKIIQKTGQLLPKDKKWHFIAVVWDVNQGIFELFINDKKIK